MTSDDHKSRRHVVGSLSLGVASATVAGAMGGTALAHNAPQNAPVSPPKADPAATAAPNAGQGTPITANGPLVDPSSLYPKPPFLPLTQDPPGLASKMQPRPDHGETTYKGSGRLAGRKALITGGDSGIGRAAAIAFAREGADVAFGYLPVEQPDADEVIKLIRDAGRKAVPLPGDIKDEAFCKKLVADAVRELGGLDILVNNAAMQKSADSITDISSEQFDATFKTNIYAPFWITKAAMEHLKPGASIINTASENAYNPLPNLLDYATTKGAIMIFTKGLAKQLATKGIRVNAVAPGPVWTPLQPSCGQPLTKLIGFGSDTSYGRPGQPVELASLYVTLASAESTFSTGQVFGATGGRGGP